MYLPFSTKPLPFNPFARTFAHRRQPIFAYFYGPTASPFARLFARRSQPFCAHFSSSMPFPCLFGNTMEDMEDGFHFRWKIENS
ncbi:hypothetical protein BASA81_018254 [Batrachochytrium salamandrivorans]|nr:hypothetical protein BASA81_018254 [Batrachochytrium salamandrivorans]